MAEPGVYGYVRLGLIAAGLGYLGRRALAGRYEAVLLALSFVFILTRYGREIRAGHELLLWVYALLLLSAGLALLLRERVLLGPFGRLDGLVVGLVVAAGLSMGLSRGMEWGGYVSLLLGVCLWFAVTRVIVPQPRIARGFRWGLCGVFALVFLLGCMRTGRALYYYERGGRQYGEGEMAAALSSFQQAAGLSADLHFGLLAEAARFESARILFAQGRLEESARTLGLEAGFVERIPAGAWEGPAGGNLYYLTSCWKELDFYRGEVEIRLFASGTPALAVWPLMRVELGGEVLGEVSVESGQPRPYGFKVEIKKRAKQRLEVFFLNDYYQAEPHIDRNLRVEEAELRYRRLEWE